MSALRARAEEYLAMRRALGFKLESHGPRLMSFDSVLLTPRRGYSLMSFSTTRRGSDLAFFSRSPLAGRGR